VDGTRLLSLNVSEQEMSTLCIQIQPNRAPEMDMARVRALGEEVASDKVLVERFSIVQGEDGGPYVNLMFETERLAELWKLLSVKLYEDRGVGAGMARASMSTCEGKHGWDDYLLLYHFDPEIKLDDFNAR